MPDTYTIYQDGKTFANEKDKELAVGIFNMLKRTFPNSEAKLVKWRPIQGYLVLKSYHPNRVHWQIKLIDWSHGHKKWHGFPDEHSKITPYEYDSLQDARYIVSTMSQSMKSAYQIKIIKITPKRKR